MQRGFLLRWPVSLLASLRAVLAKDGALLFICVALVVFGGGLRIQNVDFPGQLTFDEHHFVENAQNYLAGEADQNDHPPLGKLIIALGIQLFGDRSLGWRFFPLCFGLASIGLAYGIASALFRDRRIGALAAAFVAVDGFLIAYSRSALLDGMLTTFMLATAWCVVRARSAWPYLAASVLVGCAVSIKFSGVVVLLPVSVAALCNPAVRRLPAFLFLFLGALLVYVPLYALGLWLSGEDAGPVAVFKATRGLAEHHAALDDGTNPLTSRWYTWFLPARPIILSLQRMATSELRAMTTLGNPVLWWGSSLVVLVMSLRLFWLGPKLVFERWRSRASEAATEGAASRVSVDAGPGATRADGPGSADGFLDCHLPAVATLVLFWAAPIIPWIVSTRDSYIYHYLPAYAFGLILLAGLVGWIYRRRRLLAVAAVLVAAEVSVFYAPVWGERPLTRNAFEQRLFLERWR